jgi:hypothetical protein
MTATDPPAFTWRVRPFDGARSRGLAALAVAGAAALAAFAWGGPLLGALALFLMAGAIGPFFVTAEYRLTPREISVKSPFLRATRPWDRFRRAYVGRDGVSLSPFAAHHVLEPYRSVMLRFGPHREEVLAWVRRYGPAPEDAGDPAPAGDAAR